MSFQVVVDEWKDLPEGFSPDEDLFVCTDLHGCSQAMERLFSKRPADTRLVFLGDAIDRGPDPLRVLQKLVADPENILLRGNHDAMAWFSFPENPGSPHSHCHWRNNGGRITRDAFEKALAHGAEKGLNCPSVPKVFEDYWNAARNWWQSGNLVFVHAGIPTEGASSAWLNMSPSFAAAHDDSPYWWRPWLEHEMYTKPVEVDGKAVYVVSGHTPTQEQYTIRPYGILLDKGYRLKLGAEIRAKTSTTKARVRIIRTECNEVT